MAKVSAEQEMEERILEEMANKGIDEDAPVGPSDQFNIKPGKPLPAGFKNAPCGTDEHLCVDHAGQYQPLWYQVLIEKRFDHDQDPLVFPAANPFSVSLDIWTDVPPRIIESLKSAVEDVHSMNATPDQIRAGQPAVHKVTSRKRFVWSQLPSAKA